jgi:hypothetical protein
MGLLIDLVHGKPHIAERRKTGEVLIRRVDRDCGIADPPRGGRGNIDLVLPGVQVGLFDHAVVDDIQVPHLVVVPG